MPILPFSFFSVWLWHVFVSGCHGQPSYGLDSHRHHHHLTSLRINGILKCSISSILFHAFCSVFDIGTWLSFLVPSMDRSWDPNTHTHIYSQVMVDSASQCSKRRSILRCQFKSTKPSQHKRPANARMAAIVVYLSNALCLLHVIHLCFGHQHSSIGSKTQLSVPWYPTLISLQHFFLALYYLMLH